MPIARPRPKAENVALLVRLW